MIDPTRALSFLLLASMSDFGVASVRAGMIGKSHLMELNPMQRRAVEHGIAATGTRSRVEHVDRGGKLRMLHATCKDHTYQTAFRRVQIWTRIEY